MEEKGLNEKVVNNFAEGSNCQVFNGNISGCVFAMPGSTVTQQAGVAPAEVQGIASKWKVFEQLWHRKNMRNDYNTALDQQQCDDYMKKSSV